MPHVPLARVLFYLGLAVLSIAWLALGRRASSVVAVRWTSAAWCLPLVIGPVLFSHDVYSYLAQGQILHLGLNPYRDPPSVLGGSHFLSAVSPFWRHTTAPYGPLFLGAVELIVSVTGAHLIAGVLLIRAIDVVGVILLAVFVPRLARAFGGDPVRATWLTAASPLVLLELISAGHNDALMVGLLVAGVTLTAERRWIAAIVLCTLAATVKLPAAAGIVLIAVAWVRTRPDKLRALIQVAGAVAVPALAVGAVTGVGLSWLSTSLVSTPQKVRLAITPATGLGFTAAGIFHLNAHHLESALAVAALCLTVAVGLVVASRTRTATLPRDLGLVLLVAALCGPAAWPWYLTWSLGLLAAWPTRGGHAAGYALPGLTVASVFLVKPDGILALPLQSAPAVVAIYLVIVVTVAVARARRREPRDRSTADAARRSALVELESR
jgi:alpha-1,6-mannosyltransferase